MRAFIAEISRAVLLFACAGMLWAQGSNQSLDYCVLPNGEVIVTDGGRGIADIHPYIFTGRYGGAYWDNNFIFRPPGPGEVKEGFNAVALVKGVKVGMRWEVDSLPDGLRIHYQLVPQDLVNVSLVDIYALFPYADWENTPFDFNDNLGEIPDGPTPVPGSQNWLLRQADSAPISIGPSASLGGLAFQMTSEGLHSQLADNRYYDKNLAVIYSHGESGVDWVWEGGRKKDFDFTLTFNRPMARQPCRSSTPGPSGVLSPPATPTATDTPYPADCLDPLIDDFGDPTRNGPPPSRISRWGGRWGIQSSPGSRANVVYLPADGGEPACAKVSGNVPQQEGNLCFRASFFAHGGLFNARIHGVRGIQFWMKGDGHSYWFDLYSADDPEDPYCVNVVPPAGQWTHFRIPFAHMARKSWWGPEEGPFSHPDGTGLTGVGFESRGGGSVAFEVGQVALYHWVEPHCPTPILPLEPTRAFTPTPSSTPTGTPVPTSTSTFSPSPTSPWTPTPRPRAKRTSILGPATMGLTPFETQPMPTPTSGATLGFKMITATPTRGTTWRPTPTWTWPLEKPAQRLPVGAPTLAHPGPAFPPNLDQGTTLVFFEPPANFYVTFADGPGHYRVEVLDGKGLVLEVLYNHKVVSEKDAWLEWDGQDGKGRWVPIGLYYIVIFKNGKVLKSLAVARAGKKR